MLFGRKICDGLVVLAIACALSAAPSKAGTDSAYTIANYPVDGKAANAVAAKSQALADGQQAALRSLLKRIVPVTAYKQLARVSNLNAGDLVSGVAVRSERNSATDYIASLDFSFQADAVRQALSAQSIPFVDVQAPQVTLITVMRQGNPPVSTGDSGNWRRAWAGLDLQHTITPVKLDELKPNVHGDTIDMLLQGDDGGLRVLNNEYGTRLVVVAVAEPDLASKKLTVTLAGQDAVGPLLLKRTYRISGGDVAYTAELAAVIGLGVLEGRWKALKSNFDAGTGAAAAGEQPVWSTAATSSGGEPVALTVEFLNADQWNEIRSQILDTPGVDGLEIQAVSDRTADIALTFPGGVRGLANALGSRGLSLVNTDSGWVLRPNY